MRNLHKKLLIYKFERRTERVIIMIDRNIIIGTRSSELALWQANFVKRELETVYPGIQVELKHVKTKGDRIQDVALSKIGGKGLFTKELENEILEGTIDFAVHSLKDLQTDLAPGLKLAAVTKRHSPDDVLIAREKGMTIETIPANAEMATGSLRRRAQLLHLRPDLTIHDLRGNVNTRMRKFHESNWAGIVLARAGVERLGMQEHISSVLPFDQMLPAVGQGALGIETFEENDAVNKLLKKIEDRESRLAADAERSFLRSLGGGCQTPIAAYATVTNGDLKIDGLVCSLNGRQYFRKTIEGKAEDAVRIGSRLASILVEDGAGDCLKRDNII